MNLELKSAFSCTCSELRYTSVIDITAAVEYNFCNAACESFFCDLLSDLLSSFLVGADTFEILFYGRSGAKCYAINIVDDLSVDISV